MYKENQYLPLKTLLSFALLSFSRIMNKEPAKVQKDLDSVTTSDVACNVGITGTESIHRDLTRLLSLAEKNAFRV